MKVAPCWKLWENGRKIRLGMSYDTTPYYRRSSKEGFRERKPRKTKSNVTGCIDARRWREWDWLRKAERKSTWQRNLASLRKNLPLGRKHRRNTDETMFIVLSSWQVITRVHPVYLNNGKLAKRLPTPDQVDGLELWACLPVCTGCYPSPFIIAQPESWYSFKYHRLEDRRLSQPKRTWCEKLNCLSFYASATRPGTKPAYTKR